MFEFCHKENDVLYNSKAQRSSEQTNTRSFYPRCCYSNLKQPKSGINTRMFACASHVGDEDDGGASGPD